MTGLPSDRRFLTPRRLEVLRLAANGYTNADIARELWISEESVKSHFRLAYEQLGARDRANAIAICLVRGLIHPHEVQLRPPRQAQEPAQTPASRPEKPSGRHVPNPPTTGRQAPAQPIRDERNAA
ncbi:response regulator transcription factor [Streptomyces lavendulocolor]|uniref:response regulator transcription factor n=1 Tax=Streptomyces lavendulocolor TaxID=67316 RepID=UPI0033DEF23B